MKGYESNNIRTASTLKIEGYFHRGDILESLEETKIQEELFKHSKGATLNIIEALGYLEMHLEETNFIKKQNNSKIIIETYYNKDNHSNERYMAYIRIFQDHKLQSDIEVVYDKDLIGKIVKDVDIWEDKYNWIEMLGHEVPDFPTGKDLNWS